MCVLLVIMTLVVNIFQKEKNSGCPDSRGGCVIVYVEETTFEEAEEDDNRENDS